MKTRRFFCLFIGLAFLHLGIGQTWEDITANVGSNFLGTNEAMVSDGQRLFIMGGEGIGVLMSEDNGETFRPINTVNGAGYSLADGLFFNGLYEANGEVWLGAQNWAVGVGFQSVHRLPAGAEVWEQTDLPSAASFGALQDVIYEPVSGQYFVASSASGVFASSDARNWTNVDGGTTQLTNALLALATLDGRVFALNAFGSPSLRMTTDGGATWTPVSDYSTTNGPGRPVHVVDGTVVAVETGLSFTSPTHLSTDAGGTWETIENRPGTLNNNLSSDGSILFAPIRVSEALATALGISFLNYSSDAGRSWQTLPTDGISSEVIYQGVAASQAALRRHGDYLFLLGDVSIDSGDSFEGRLYRIPLAGLDPALQGSGATDPLVDFLGAGTVAHSANLYSTPSLGWLEWYGDGWAYSYSLGRFIWFNLDGPPLDSAFGYWFGLQLEDGFAWAFTKADFWAPTANNSRNAYLYLPTGLPGTPGWFFFWGVTGEFFPL